MISLDADDLRRICREAGADDAGFVDIERKALDKERDEMRYVLPGVRSIISLCCRINPESMRAPPRHYANSETQRVIHRITDVAHRIAVYLRGRGVRALVPPVSFPMDMQRWPGKMWEVSHKPVAVEAGLGHMGIHRNVIHPRFGNFILLESILIDAAVDRYDRPLEDNPCLECNLCVAACPVGAISTKAPFDVNACLTHNYREFLGGFQDWVDTLTDSRSASVYRRKLRETETLSWWQSLAHGPNYKSSYCMAVCPAGTENYAPYQAAPKAYVDQVVRPLRERPEPVYVIAGSGAEQAVARNRNKEVRYVNAPRHLRREAVRRLLVRLQGRLEPASAEDFVMNLEFTGRETLDSRVEVAGSRVRVGHDFYGDADALLRADSDTFLAVMSSRTSSAFVAHFLRALVTRQFRYQGSPRVLARFVQLCLNRRRRSRG